MKSKLNFLIGMSLKKKIKTKWFLVANIILALIIVGLINIDHVIDFFGGDFNEKQVIYVIDNTNETYDLFKTQFKNSESLKDNEESNYKIINYKKSLKDAKKKITKDDKPYILVFDNDSSVLDVTMISEGYLETTDYQLISNVINSTKVALAINKSNISESVLASIYSPVNIKREYIDDSKKTDDENMSMMMSTIFPIVVLPFFMLTIFLVQMIGAEVNDEKTTRGMEIIISNVSPKTHFFSKVIAGNLFVILQALMLLLYSLIGLGVRKIIGQSGIESTITNEIGNIISNISSSSIGSKFVYIIPITLLLMVLTFVAYSLLAGILASMTTNIEDFQQLQTPIIIISLAGYYLAMMAGVFNGATFIRVLSYFPLISAILAPSLLLLGQIGIVDMLISIVVVIITNYLFIKYGLRIYKQGILNYTSKDLWKKMWKAMKN